MSFGIVCLLQPVDVQGEEHKILLQLPLFI
jgi:hypothetical protein